MSALGNRDIGERNEHFCVLLFSVPLRSGKRVYYHWAEGRKGQFLGERISCSFYQICVYSTALYFERASEFSGNHDVTTLGWELSNYYTTIELIFQDKTVDMGKTQVKLGVKYSLSDVGTSSQTVQPILVYGDNSVLIGKSFSSPHRSKKLQKKSVRSW